MSQEDTAAPIIEPRADPRAFRLSGPPPGVTRLSRKALAVIGMAAGLGIGGTLIYALRPSANPETPSPPVTDTVVPGEAIGAAPRDYSQVPKLGPPLPGDLGRPMLAAGQGTNGLPSNANQPDPQAAARQRAAQERDAARRSTVFLVRSEAIQAGANVPVGESPPSIAPTSARVPPSEKMRFLASDADRQTVAGGRLTGPPSTHVIQAGSIIAAALITGIRSDLPGQITAQVTQNIYDSPTGRILLIPQGTRLIGNYDAQVDAGQTRLLFAWDRLIFADGSSIGLDRESGADASGHAGLEDKVDRHWGGIARAALISTLLGLGTELATGNDEAIVRALRRGSQDSVNQAGQQVVQRELAIPPTLTIRPGHPLRVMVTRDLVIEKEGHP
jgi:type IV secretion system protein VirB10